MGSFDNKDTLLVKSLQKGDYHAFDLLYKKYSLRIYKFALKLLKSETLADEVLQHVYITVWEKKQKINTEKSFKNYLFTISYNEIIRQLKELQKTISIDQLDLNQVIFDHSTSQNVDYEFTKAEIEKIINSLPKKCQQVFKLSRIEGLSHKEIANKLNISTKTVENHISKALSVLKTKLVDTNLTMLLFFFLFFS